MRRSTLILASLGCLFLWGLIPLSGLAAEAPRSLNLKEALSLAWKANPTLHVSRLEQLIADQDVVRARSGFLPKVNNQVSQTIYDQAYRIRVPTPTPSGSVSFPLTNNNFWLSQTSAEQTIFDFWANSSRYQAAILGQSASRLDTAQTRDNIFLMVCQGYFKVLRGEKLVNVAQQEVVQFGDQLKDAKNLYDFGVATYNDVLQAEVALADSQQRLITAKNDVINAKSALNKLIGLPIPTPLSLTEEKELATPTLKLAEASDKAVKQRSDLKAATDRIDQQEQNITHTKSQYYPRFYAQAGHNWQPNFYYVNSSQWFAIFGLKWTLFNGLDTHAQVQQARDKVEQLKVQRQDLSEQVRLDVQTAYLAINETADRIRVTEKAVKQGEENLRLNRERYREQVGTATDVVDAVTLLTKTRVNFYNARYDHQLAKAQFLWAIGAINDLLPQGESQHVR
jgi:outer membrane protein